MSDAESKPRKTVFDDLHRSQEDPWDFATSAYEQDKRAATIAALPRPSFRSILEVGCSTGYLSEALATVGDEVLALDVSDVAIARAAERVGASAAITFRQAELPKAWPSGRFDLIVFSEVLYFMKPHEITRSAALAHGALTGAGLCLLVNWTGETDLEISGEEAASLFLESDRWEHIVEERAETYLLQLLKPRV